MVDIHKLVRDHKELVVNTRRDLHMIPEVGYTEEKTSAYVADYLRREGLEVQTGIAQFGVLGLLKHVPEPIIIIEKITAHGIVAFEADVHFAAAQNDDFGIFNHIEKELGIMAR